MNSGSASRRIKDRHETVAALRAGQHARQRRRRGLVLGIWIVAILAIVGLVTAGLLSARPRQSAEAGTAPDFTLPASDGSSLTLSALRGTPVLLYFNEGAGCDACIVQMAQIEAEPGFGAAGVKVLPIVMNSAAQINAERARLGVRSPFLLDDGTVSAAYGTLGTGMHAGLPGHGFVLIDADGNRVWSGDYPSMWIDPGELLGIVRGNL